MSQWQYRTHLLGFFYQQIQVIWEWKTFRRYGHLSTFNVTNSTISLRPTMVLGCCVWIHNLTRVNKSEWIMLWYESMWAILAMTGCIDVIIVKMIKMTIIIHSVESPSMVDPQWNIWHWGSKWNLRTVCWDAVGCEWGTTSVYFVITNICFIPSRLPVFAVEPQYRHQDFFIFVKGIIWRTHTKSSKNFMLV